MIARLLFHVTRNLPARAIHINDLPYMERYHVARVCGCTVLLHRFLSADGDREVHDHPWRWAIGVPLVGSYMESRLLYLDPSTGWRARARLIWRFRPNPIGPRTFHRILSVRPGTWTLFIHGPRFKGWGFLRRLMWGRPIGAAGVGLREVDRLVEYHQPYPESDRLWHLHAVTGRELRIAEGTDTEGDCHE